MFGAAWCLLLVGAASQEAWQQQELRSDIKSVEKAAKAASFWQSQTQTETVELHDALSHEKAAALGSASLTACLRTRDVVQMVMQKLQTENEDFSQKIPEEKRLASVVNQTMHTGLSDCEARLKVTLSNNTAAVKKLQDVQGELQKNQDDLKAAIDSAQKENAGFVSQVAEQEKEFAKQIVEAKALEEKKAADVKKRHAQVMKAHTMLKKAHEALQKQHEAMRETAEAQRTRRSTESAQQVSLKGQTQQCQASLQNSTSAQTQMRTSEKDVHQAAKGTGAAQSNLKWSDILKNMTEQNAALDAQVEKLEKSATEQENKAKNVVKDLPEMGQKLRQCRASREKTELDMQKALEHCPKREAFLQMQVLQWP